ncbi:hypothetical protein QUF88_19250 [Bacillus sp. DX1.1]|uniref:hypothetical protein n=1 Tax=unclassified Bacillus (in: firmicutes) TaxID=185979 RepID=UPI0025708E46|nr:MULTISPECIES: hypothetical protein [unclassified Bacillus (in: firmicutes)]MDM5155849.1 hypothetical protein [Bacillus sp. DX1.1]WJE80145.1 hypothetical protein QRE67_16780 [Bacillus sp. DX3.1]
MSKHLIISAFIDKDTLQGYSEGDVYESKDTERIAFLQEKRFLRVPESKQEDSDGLKHAGGGYYQLPNGEKVKGKEAALEALKEIDQKGE